MASLVGRRRPVRDLGVLVSSAAAGRGSLLLVSGDAGIGKTRLAEEALDLAADAGVRRAWATCRQEAGAPPFWPWTEALGPLAHGPLPFDESRAASDPDVARFQLFVAAEQQLRAIGDHQPTIVVFDDLHWADPPSLRLLAFVAPALLSMPVLVVATHRPDEPGSALAEVLPELLRHGQHQALGGLTEDDLTELISELSDAAATPAALAELTRRTRGNPLFAGEYLRLAEALGSLDEVLADDRLPAGIRAVLHRRLAALGDPDVVTAAAVLGTEGSTEVLAEVLERPVEDALAEADRAGVVRVEVARWAFTHPLLRAAALDGLSGADLARWHGRAAAALEGRGGSPSELARHFAAAGDRSATSRHAERAGAEAMAMLAYEEAVDWFTEALVGAEESRRLDLLQRRGDARLAAGDAGGARADHEAAADLARALGSAEHLAQAALGLGSGTSGFEVPVGDWALVALLREALDGLPEAPTLLRVRLLARLAVALPFGWTTAAERGEVADAAIAMARELDDPVALGAALSAHADAISGPEHTAQRLSEASEVLVIAQQTGDVALELLARRLRVKALFELGDRSTLDAEMVAYAAAADSIRHPLYAWYVPQWRCAMAMAEGRYDDAIVACVEAEAIGERADSENARLLTISSRMAWLDQVGLYQQLIETVDEMFGTWPEYVPMMRGVEARCAALAGQLDRARAALDAMQPQSFADGSYGAEALGTAFYVADTVRLLGGHPLARPLYELLLPHRHLMIVDGIGAALLGSVEQSLGRLAEALGDDEAARAHHAAAAERHRAFGATALLAPTAGARPCLEREGDGWAATYEGRTVWLGHAKGLGDLARLLAEPGREVHVLELMGEGGATVVEPDLGPVLDDRARAAYQVRLADLDEDLAAADETGDADRSARLADERDALIAELSAASGLRGRPRHLGGTTEKARSAVTQRIKAAITRLDEVHPAFGAHLRQTVTTGTRCRYGP